MTTTKTHLIIIIFIIDWRVVRPTKNERLLIYRIQTVLRGGGADLLVYRKNFNDHPENKPRVKGDT